jgi:hypothetical protein
MILVFDFDLKIGYDRSENYGAGKIRIILKLWKALEALKVMRFKPSIVQRMGKFFLPAYIG